MIRICKEGDLDNGNVRIFVSEENSQTVFRILLDSTVAVKPEDGVKEVLFSKNDFEDLLEVTH